MRNFCHFNTIGTDHNLAPTIELYLPNKIRWGQGSFCLTNSIPAYSHVKTSIENLWNNWKETKSNFEYLNDWWDYGKMMLKNECIQLSMEINLTKSKR